LIVTEVPPLLAPEVGLIDATVGGAANAVVATTPLIATAAATHRPSLLMRFAAHAPDALPARRQG
jgi:hypothetical protein